MYSQSHADYCSIFVILFSGVYNKLRGYRRNHFLPQPFMGCKKQNLTQAFSFFVCNLKIEILNKQK